jgi:hypothetical protein
MRASPPTLRASGATSVQPRSAEYEFLLGEIHIGPDGPIRLTNVTEERKRAGE